MIGAFYYAWYGDDWEGNKNWKTQTVRYNLYRGDPVIGWYKSNNKDVIEEHVEMAKEAGIDYFIVSYNNGNIRKDYLDLVAEVCEENDFKFCIHYETINIFNDPIVIEGENQKILFDSIKNLSEKYFNNRCYYKIAQKPVLFLYTSRRITGDLSFLNGLRVLVGDMYLIGDEIWWSDGSIKNPENRIEYFDAIYSYNLYMPSYAIGGEIIGSDFIAMAQGVYQNYLTYCKRNNVALFPSIKPRYNDSGVRKRKEGHYPLPPENGNFFKEYFNKIYPCRFNTKDLLICSFNEWFEDTQIEPFITFKDGGDSYDSNPGYDDLYLKITKSFKGSMD